jgi:NAD(P)-dependent dehydrogenase (short-subunit alcohol dehydrogenase family)
MRLKGKLALVTGAGSGIGRETARLFANEGARVVATDIDEQGLLATTEGQEAIFSERMDVGNANDVARAMGTAASKMGGLDILVCAAGVVGSKFGDGPAAECTEEAWDQVMRVNLRGVWLCSKYAIPLMLSRGAGSIITVSSVTALCPPSDFFRSHAYITSKGGVITLTKCIAAYYARQKIRANVIAPGMIDTPMSKRMQGIPEVMDYLRDRQPLGVLGSPTDVANAALFLASDASRFITGAVIPVDGGWIAHS